MLKWAVDFCAQADNPIIPIPMFQEVDTTPAAVVNLMEALLELSPTAQTQTVPVQVPAQAAVQVLAAALPAVDLPL